MVESSKPLDCFLPSFPFLPFFSHRVECLGSLLLQFSSALRCRAVRQAAWTVPWPLTLWAVCHDQKRLLAADDGSLSSPSDVEVAAAAVYHSLAHEELRAFLPFFSLTFRAILVLPRSSFNLDGTPLPDFLRAYKS